MQFEASQQLVKINLLPYRQLAAKEQSLAIWVDFDREPLFFKGLLRPKNHKMCSYFQEVFPRKTIRTVGMQMQLFCSVLKMPSDFGRKNLGRIFLRGKKINECRPLLFFWLIVVEWSAIKAGPGWLLLCTSLQKIIIEVKVVGPSTQKRAALLYNDYSKKTKKKKLLHDDDQCCSPFLVH